MSARACGERWCSARRAGHAMGFRLAVVYFTAHGLLATAANVIAAGARKVHPLRFYTGVACTSTPARW